MEIPIKPADKAGKRRLARVTNNRAVVRPEHLGGRRMCEKQRLYRDRLLSVLSSRKYEWLSTSERIWLEELQEESDTDDKE